MQPEHTEGTAALDRLGPATAERCQAPREILARVGDKWSMLVVMLLVERPMRFNQLRRTVEGISQRMLTLTLRGLERDGLVARTAYPTVPPQVDYRLTPLGHSLAEPVRALGDWARRNQARIRDARTHFDTRDAETSPQTSEDARPDRRGPAAA